MDLHEPGLVAVNPVGELSVKINSKRLQARRGEKPLRTGVIEDYHSEKSSGSEGGWERRTFRAEREVGARLGKVPRQP